MKCRFCQCKEMEIINKEFKCRIEDKTLSIDNIPHFECSECQGSVVDPWFLMSLNQAIEKLLTYFSLVEER